MNTAIRRIVNRVPLRKLSGVPRKIGQFEEKSFKEAWLSDAGAYPVMATILFGLCFTTSVTVWAAATFTDSRLTDKTRKSLFRGEYAAEYQHPVKPQSH